MKSKSIVSVCGILAFMAAAFFSLAPVRAESLVRADSRRREYSEEIAKSINSYLIDDDWVYSFDEKLGLFVFTLNGFDSVFSKLEYQVLVGEDHYIVRACFPLNASYDNQRKIGKIAEMVCRMNYGLKNGSFDLDFSDGEISYRVYVDCDRLPLSNSRIADSILLPSLRFEQYGDAILSVLSGIASPEEAVAAAEE